ELVASATPVGACRAKNRDPRLIRPHQVPLSGNLIVYCDHGPRCVCGPGRSRRQNRSVCVSGKLLRQRIDLRTSYADNRQTKTDQKGLPTLLAKSLDLPKHKIHLGITSTVQVQLVRAGLQMYRYTANFKVIHGEGRARQAGGKSAREIACRAAWSGPTGCG